MHSTVGMRVPILGTGSLQELFDSLGPYLYVRVHIFSILAKNYAKNVN